MVAASHLGFDDSRGDLYLTKNDHIAYRYEILGLLGKGSFGQVCKCYDHKTKELVAVKIIRNKQRFQKQGLVEVKILDRIVQEDLGSDSSLVQVKDHFMFRSHLCFVFDHLGTNLYEWVKAGNFHGIHTHLINRFCSQLLDGLIVLKRCKIVHCDLKPENILLADPAFTSPGRWDVNQGRWKIPSEFSMSDPRHEIKLIDFGSSCYETERLYTYVQSRFYRAPEVILGTNYTTAIDMWSLGCILCELYTGYPLFPGENEQEQLWCMLETIGLPSTKFIAQCSRSSIFFDSHSPKPYTSSRGKKRRICGKPLGIHLGNPPSVFVNFIEKLLVWDPAERYTPQQALQHPFITGKRQATALQNILPPIPQKLQYTDSRLRWK